tara:strand:- start:7408 stop:7896 length:489 start_codon:yes stop_codon:yes gene_type:complete
MSIYEYKVIPAPFSGKRGKGVKGADGRFANALSETINELAGDGWEYIRAESLPSVERKGVMRKRHESFQNVLVFRRANEVKESEIADTSQTQSSTETFNPFKKFAVKPEPTMSSTALAAKVDDTADKTADAEDITDDINDVIEDALEGAKSTKSKRPSKPVD